MKKINMIRQLLQLEAVNLDFNKIHNIFSIAAERNDIDIINILIDKHREKLRPFVAHCAVHVNTACASSAAMASNNVSIEAWLDNPNKACVSCCVILPPPCAMH